MLRRWEGRGDKNKLYRDGMRASKEMVCIIETFKNECTSQRTGVLRQGRLKAYNRAETGAMCAVISCLISCISGNRYHLVMKSKWRESEQKHSIYRSLQQISEGGKESTHRMWPSRCPTIRRVSCRARDCTCTHCKHNYQPVR